MNVEVTVVLAVAVAVVNKVEVTEQVEGEGGGGGAVDTKESLLLEFKVVIVYSDDEIGDMGVGSGVGESGVKVGVGSAHEVILPEGEGPGEVERADGVKLGVEVELLVLRLGVLPAGGVE